MRGEAEREDLCGRMVGEFVLRERIDEGGFGAVYRCEQPLLGREAVVKVLHQRLRRNDVLLQRFMREAQLASRLHHPYAAHVYAFGIEHDDGLFWIAMEMVQGTTLSRWLRDRGPLPLEQFLPFFDLVAQVVQAAHARGIVHRDLKPSNVMVIEESGVLLPKLLDFGIAKLFDEATNPSARVYDAPPRPRASSELERVDASGVLAAWVNPSEVATQTGATEPGPRMGRGHRLTDGDVTVGSPPYMSPEQWSNAGSVGPPSDLYALAILGYEALTGRRPFHAATVPEWAEQHCHAAVPPLGAGFSPAIDQVFQRALAKLPDDRFANALEFAAELRAAAGVGIPTKDLPRLDERVRDAWLADAPQPLAESVAVLDAARNVYQARDAAHEAIRNLLRYLLTLALATRAQVREDRGGSALLETIRTMRRRDLSDDERIALIRLLVRPLIDRRGAHPIPELVDLVTPFCDNGPDGLEQIAVLHATADRGGTEATVRARLAQLVPELTQLLRRTAFVLEYVLVVPRDGAPERWTGIRRQHRIVVTMRAGELVRHHPMLLDLNRRVCVDLWPLAQAVPPTEGAPSELFLFDGRGRNGARLVAAPFGYEHHDQRVWDWIATRVIAEVELDADASEDDAPPYLGLVPFASSDAPRFVGREAEIDSLVNRLRQRALQVVVGPSGAGKSSFLHAGVLPALPPSWRSISLRPGSAPLSSLAARLAFAGLDTDDLRDVLERVPAHAAKLIARDIGPGMLVIVVDQLEELFTQCASATERLQFAQVLAQLAASAEAPIRVICAIRDDFLMQLDAMAPLRALLAPALVLLGNPSREALVRIVVEPAARAGYALSDPQLADDMVSAVIDRPGALALLSFTASRLWELRDRRFRQLTRNAYDAMGGVGGALGRHAETTLDQCSTSEHRLVREIFRHLVTADGTRAQITVDELHQRLAAPRADAVVDKLVTARLVEVSEGHGENHVGIIHEALIDAWPRLQGWIREDVDDARMRDQIRAAARQWHDRDRPRSLLWREDVLVDLQRWLRRTSAPSLSEIEAAFVESSLHDGRRVKRLRRAAGVILFSVLILLSGFLYLSVLATRASQELAERRLVDSYVERGRQALLSGHFGEALAYAAAAIARGDRSEIARFILARAADPQLAEQARLPGLTGFELSANFSSDGRRILTASNSGVRMWDAGTAKLLYEVENGSAIRAAMFSADGRALYTAAASGAVRVRNAADGALVRELSHDLPEGGRASYAKLAITNDGRLIAAMAASAAVVHVWDASTGAFVREVPIGRAGKRSALTFSADGRWLAANSGNEPHVIDTLTWESTPLTGPNLDAVTDLSFDPRGNQLAVVTSTGDASIWSIAHGTRIQHLQEIGAAISHVAYSPDGAYIVIASRDGTKRVWDPTTGAPLLEFKDHTGAVTWVEFDATSRFVVSTGTDGLVVVSDIPRGLTTATFQSSGDQVSGAHFDPASRRVVSASWDGAAHVWDVTPSYLRWASDAIGPDCANLLNVEEDRRFLAVECGGRGTQVWDTAHDQLLATLASQPGDSDAPQAFPAVSAAGDRAAIASGATITVYELPGGRVLRKVVHAAGVTALAFARSGSDLASGSADGALRITHDTGEAVELASMSGGLAAVAFAPDGRLIATAPGQLRVYTLGGGAADLDIPTTARALRISSDGRRLLTVESDPLEKPILLFDLEQLHLIARLSGHKGRVFSARFVREDREIVTTGGDGIPRRWDAETGRPLKAYREVSPVFVPDAVLDPSGAILVTAGGDGWLHFVDAATGTVIWNLRAANAAEKTGLNGFHFQGSDLVVRSSLGRISRWQFRDPPAPAMLRELLRCLPVRFDDVTGGLVDQATCPTLRGPS